MFSTFYIFSCFLHYIFNVVVSVLDMFTLYFQRTTFYIVFLHYIFLCFIFFVTHFYVVFLSVTLGLIYGLHIFLLHIFYQLLFNLDLNMCHISSALVHNCMCIHPCCRTVQQSHHRRTDHSWNCCMAMNSRISVLLCIILAQISSLHCNPFMSRGELVPCTGPARLIRTRLIRSWTQSNFFC